MTTEHAKKKILICEDDSSLGIVLKSFLELHDFHVVLERDGRLGLAAFQREKFDICLLDVMMPHMDGFQLAEEIRDIDHDVPLFFITAKTMKEDMITGYKLGADDYITKPFDTEVLMMKIKAMLKRNEDVTREHTNAVFEIGKFTFTPRHRELVWDGEPYTLSPKENELLRILVEFKNNLLPREAALKKIWGSDTYFNGRSMDVYIAKLRKLLAKDPTIQIKNQHGEGFRLEIKEP
ncbi:MAG: response regulator transcription factor [Bacteroidetes bacterium]|nr:response regulator transcription factor [Bacteroidota bacterium]